MIYFPELGTFLLVLAFSNALVGAIYPKNIFAILKVQCGVLLLAFLILIGLFLYSDFSTLLVANHSSVELPWYYKMSAAWGSHEGSMLLWCVWLGLWSVQSTDKTSARILLWLQAVFIAFLVTTSHPFQRIFPAPATGADLNPMLQDLVMIIHPPILYAGYVGLAYPFARTLSMLIHQKIEVAVIQKSLALPWAFLTAGIMLGSFWAYYVLGWGGYWFWDPVENASLMPWLMATAGLHAHKRLPLLAAIAGVTSFILSVFGTFLVRSGSLVSVHSFATDPKRGLFLLAITVLIAVCSLPLLARASMVSVKKSGARWRLALQLGVYVITAIVFLGTVYPLFAQYMGSMISIGTPYFKITLAPIVAALLVIFIAAHAGKKGVIATLLVAPIALFFTDFITVLLYILCFWSAVGLLAWWVVRKGAFKFRGSFVTHAGFLMLIMGVLLNHSYAHLIQVRVGVTETVQLGGRAFTLQEAYSSQNPHSETVGVVLQTGTSTLHPHKEFFKNRQIVLSQSAIIPGIWDEYVVTLGDIFEDNSFALKIQHEPFVRFIWLGAIIMIIGVLLACSKKSL